MNNPTNSELNKHESLFQATERIVERLRELQECFPDYSESAKGVYKLRRELQEAQNEYLKQGERIPISTKFEIRCCECDQVQLREEDYYLHLRHDHQYPDEDAATESNNPRSNYDSDLAQLRRLIAQYTGALLQDV